MRLFEPPAAARQMMWARFTTLGGVLGARTHASSTRRCSVETVSGPAGCHRPAAYRRPTRLSRYLRDTRLEGERARSQVQAYLEQLGDENLVIAELMEFERNFYAIVSEQSTGVGAFELLVDPWTGAVLPEPGPNMMWNSKYGHMGGLGGTMGGAFGMMGVASPMTGPGMRSDACLGIGPVSTSGETEVSADGAVQAAQACLEQALPGTEATDPMPFYGYFTLPVERDGEVVGMLLSVHGATGEVWYHTWHGDYRGEV